MARLPLLRACLLVAAILPAFAHAESAFILKTGLFELSHENQSINGIQRAVGEDTEHAFALAWEKRRPDGVALGVEFLRFGSDWRSPGASGDISARALMFTMKRYQETALAIYPFLGRGIGGMYSNASGLDFDSGFGPALQLSGGIELRSEMAGLYAEIRGLYAEAGNFWGDEVNLSGVGAFAGLSLRF